jgi:hypothetical protein
MSPTKLEEGYAGGNRNKKIFVIVELRPDWGGLIRPYINYLGRDEDVCIFMGDSSE